jgi:hypothetical protein
MQTITFSDWFDTYGPLPIAEGTSCPSGMEIDGRHYMAQVYIGGKVATIWAAFEHADGSVVIVSLAKAEELETETDGAIVGYIRTLASSDDAVQVAYIGGADDE